jgi:hypothetical protein
MKLHLSLFIFLVGFAVSAIATNVVVTPSGGNDDWQNIQDKLNRGDTVVLISGATYKIGQRLNINFSNSGIKTNGEQPATIEMLPSFNYADPDITSFGPRWSQTNGIGIYIGDDLRNPITRVGGVSNILLENFHLKKYHVDGSYVMGVWIYGAANVQIKRMEFSGFSLGYIVALDSVRDVQIKHSSIHDSWANTAPRNSSGSYFNKMPQLTGIQIDDNKITIPTTNEHVLSKNILIANNTISRLRFGNNLFNLPRSGFGNTGNANLGFETDGITIGNSDSPVEGGKDNIVVAMNRISEVGEGIDTFATNFILSNNVISDTFLFGIKMIHGARDAVVENNLISRSGLNGIVLGGSPAARAHVSGNIIRDNEISNVGNRDFACGSNVNNPSVFRLTANCGANEISGIRVQDNNGSEATGMVKHTFIVNNIIDKGIILDYVAINTLILNNRLDSGSVNLTVKSGASGTIADVATSRGDYQREISGSKLIYSDFNGDGLDDVFISWNSSGKNYLYLNSMDKLGNIFTRIDDPLPRTGINGNPDYLVSGNFDGDSAGKTDLMFVWKSTGQNRAAYNYSNGSFTADNISNPISTSAINGDSTNVVVGDFDGNGKDDMCYLWKNSGLNRCVYSFGISSFSTYAESIPAPAINSDPDVFKGDFNGDGRSDLYFIWRNDGGNRLFCGAAPGTFNVCTTPSTSAPIAPLAINSSADKIMSGDFNADGVTDIDFFWSTTNVKRLFLGSYSGFFTAE